MSLAQLKQLEDNLILAKETLSRFLEGSPDDFTRASFGSQLMTRKGDKRQVFYLEVGDGTNPLTRIEVFQTPEEPPKDANEPPPEPEPREELEAVVETP